MARFLAARNIHVVVSDREVASRTEAGNVIFVPESQASLDTITSVVVSPGVPDSNTVLVAARARGLSITNPTQLFLELCPCPVLGVTGSSGKSTTTSLIAAMLVDGGFHTGLGGNIGLPMLDLLDDLTPTSIAVIELSSFQLELTTISPHIAVLTNLTPNHLDRHGSFAAYAAAKAHIFAQQAESDFAVVNGSDSAALELAAGARGRLLTFDWSPSRGSTAFVRDGMIVRSFNGIEEVVVSPAELGLHGRHNVENALAAVAATAPLGVDTGAARSALRRFTGLPHRLEPVAEIDGVRYVDDSIATSPERAATGIAATEGPIVWIAGGRSKHLPWAVVAAAATGRLRGVVLLGEASDEIEDGLQASGGFASIPVARATSLGEAVETARRRALRGDTILLSPGCTSYDMFRDFEERGNLFQEIVKRWETS